MSKHLYKPINDYGAFGFTPDGGVYQTFKNHTGAASVKGTIVMPSAADGSAVDIATAGTPFATGVIYESEVADGSPVKVVVYGQAQVLLQDSQSATLGYWCSMSSLADGRMVQSAALPLLYTTYAEGIGVSLETATGGTNVLAWVQLQFT